jgi:uncharacterized membrane protein YcaP (DUF421 family)
METVVRVALAYVFVVAGLRLTGKRSFGQLSPADLVVLMLIPEFFQQAISREDFSMTNALVAVSTLLILVVVADTLGYRFPRFGHVLTGKPVTVAAHGELRPDRLDRERLSPDEVLDAMHRAGLERMDQVKWAVLYPDGTIAVVPLHGGAARGLEKRAEVG